MKAIFRIFESVGRLFQIGGLLVLGFMAVSVTYDATMRYLFAAPTSWSLEVNSFLVVYLALMTAADVERRGEHIGITMAVDNMNRTGRRVVSVVIGLVGAGFCGILAWRGWLMTVDAFEYGERVSSGFGTPYFVPYSMLPLGFGMLGIQFLINMMRDPANLPRSESTHV